MNRRQAKARAKHLKTLAESAAIRKAKKLREYQEQFALRWHRDWVREQWKTRCEFRRIRALDRPKTTCGDW